MLNNFAKADRDWLEPLLGAIAAAPDLAEGANDKFQSFVAHAMHMEAEAADERPEPAPRQGRDAPSTGSDKPPPPRAPSTSFAAGSARQQTNLVMPAKAGIQQSPFAQNTVRW